MREGNQEMQRRDALEAMQKLISAKANDAVKLAYLSEEQLSLIDKLDLTALAEFKRSSNGVVEVKLQDRMKAIEQMLTLSEEGEDQKVNALLSFFRGEDEG